MATADSQLFDDTFHITDLNAAKYDRVSRITGTSVGMDVTLTLDVNTQLYPVAVNDTVNIVLASTLSLDGTKDDGKGWRETANGVETLASMYDYVCHGKIYRFEEGEGENM